VTSCYDIIAIDLDGTLLDRDGCVDHANIEAINDARNAGIETVICTGRGLAESRSALDAIDQRSPVVVAGGSIIACCETSETLHRFSMCEKVVARAVERLTGQGHPVMILKDPVQTGYEYLVVASEGRDLHPVSTWWFERMGVRVRHARHVSEDEHPACTVRIGVCGDDDDMGDLLTLIHAEFHDETSMHHFPAVVSMLDNEPGFGSDANGASATSGNANGTPSRPSTPQRVHILELFHKDADKWASLRWLADQRSVPTSRIAAIGDEINDLQMIRQAGLGVAMENAVDVVKDVANVLTRSNTDHGVAHAIEQILRGRW
jgi:5-amino-6-(5-phospho-D-ribitylamino)uracil phosphatase